MFLLEVYRWAQGSSYPENWVAFIWLALPVASLPVVGWLMRRPAPIPEGVRVCFWYVVVSSAFLLVPCPEPFLLLPGLVFGLNSLLWRSWFRGQYY